MVSLSLCLSVFLSFFVWNFMCIKTITKNITILSKWC
jgi:hypothetical protein